MKTFIGAIIIILLTVACVITISLICNNALEQMDDILCDMSKSGYTKDKIDELKDMWDKYRAVISSGAHEEHIHSVDIQLENLIGYFDYELVGDYAACAAVLRRDIERLSDFFIVSADSIF